MESNKGCGDLVTTPLNAVDDYEPPSDNFKVFDLFIISHRDFQTRKNSIKVDQNQEKYVYTLFLPENLKIWYQKSEGVRNCKSFRWNKPTLRTQVHRKKTVGGLDQNTFWPPEVDRERK